MSRRALFRAAAGLALAPTAGALAAACGPSIRTVAPPGLEPLDAMNRAPETTAAPYPETLATVATEGEDHVKLHGRGYINLPLSTVWPAIYNPDACANRLAVTQYMVTLNSQPTYAHSFRIHNIIRDVILVEFDADWRLDVTYGAIDAPTSVAARFEKINGSDVISLLRGSVIARSVSESVTEVQIIEHLDSLINRESIARDQIVDLFASYRELAHGRPLPTMRG